MDRSLGSDFFARTALEVARALLGQRLVRVEAGRRLSGRIVETEAYSGPDDLGCHGRSGRTRRNESLWRGPGTVYVYFNYGMHWLANLVTDRADFPSAVLLRSIAPEEGLQRIRERRAGRPAKEWTNGPAKLCRALGIDGALDGHDACSEDAELFVERVGELPDRLVRTGPRIGLYTVPEPWKSMPWRFWVDPSELPK